MIKKSSAARRAEPAADEYRRKGGLSFMRRRYTWLPRRIFYHCSTTRRTCQAKESIPAISLRSPYERRVGNKKREQAFACSLFSAPRHPTENGLPYALTNAPRRGTMVKNLPREPCISSARKTETLCPRTSAAVRRTLPQKIFYICQFSV